MPHLYWYDWPLIVCLTVLVFGMVMFVVMGIDLFPGHDGGRWVILVILTAFAGITCGANRATE